MVLLAKCGFSRYSLTQHFSRILSGLGVLEFYFKLYCFAYEILLSRIFGIEDYLENGFLHNWDHHALKSTKTLPEFTYFPPHLQKKREQFFHQNEGMVGQWRSACNLFYKIFVFIFVRFFSSERMLHNGRSSTYFKQSVKFLAIIVMYNFQTHHQARIKMQQVNQLSCDCAQILPILGQWPSDLHHGKEQVWNGRPTWKTAVATGPRNHKGIKPFVRNRILRPFVHQLPQVRGARYLKL